MVRKSNIDMLNRKIYNYLRNFFEMEKKALLVSGARQVGKTFAIRKVGKECFADVVEFNFLNNPKYREAFKSPSDAKEILLRLSALAEKKLTPGNTLILKSATYRVSWEFTCKTTKILLLYIFLAQQKCRRHKIPLPHKAT